MNTRPQEVALASAKILALLLRLKSDTEREMVLAIVQGKICPHCGVVKNGICHCQNDE